MTVEEVDGAESSEGGETKNYCVKCCIKKKYAEYREEKGEKVLTFFYEEKKLPKARFEIASSPLMRGSKASSE